MRRGTTLKILDEEGDFSPFPIPQKESGVIGDEVSKRCLKVKGVVSSLSTHWHDI